AGEGARFVVASRRRACRGGQRLVAPQPFADGRKQRWMRLVPRVAQGGLQVRDRGSAELFVLLRESDDAIGAAPGLGERCCGLNPGRGSGAERGQQSRQGFLVVFGPWFVHFLRDKHRVPDLPQFHRQLLKAPGDAAGDGPLRKVERLAQRPIALVACKESIEKLATV